MQDWELEKTIPMASYYTEEQDLWMIFASLFAFPIPVSTRNSVPGISTWCNAPCTYMLYVSQKPANPSEISPNARTSVFGTQQGSWSREWVSNPALHLWLCSPMVGWRGKRKVRIPALRILTLTEKCWSVIKQSADLGTVSLSFLKLRRQLK